MSDNRVYSYSAVLMGSPILLKLYVHDEPLASRVFQLIKGYEDLFTVNRAHSGDGYQPCRRAASGDGEPPGVCVD